MPLLKSKSKKAMSKNIETEMNAGKPQKQSVAIAYSIMRRAKKNKMAQGGLADPEHEKMLSEEKITDHFPTYDTRKQKDPMGYDDTLETPANEHEKRRKALENTDIEDLSLQEHMMPRPDDKEDRGLNLFDGEAERIDPMSREMADQEISETLQDEHEADADDIVSRIMRKMRRK